MEKNEAMNEILNDLVKINNDRIAGYQKAIDESKGLDIDLKAIFEEMIKQSNQYKGQLAQVIESNEGIVENDTTTTGKIYRAWMDIKTAMEETDRHSILESCEFGEDATQRAYEAALAAQPFCDESLRALVTEQQAALKKSHDMIKIQRNAHKALLK
jgi:uncharacterized protein (TIGR02284 family)